MQERELLTFLFGIGVLVYLLVQHRKLAILRDMNLPILAYSALVLGWLARLLNSSFPAPALLILEHGFYTLTAILLFSWLRGLEARGQ